jgi:hypothetical protein
MNRLSPTRGLCLTLALALGCVLPLRAQFSHHRGDAGDRGSAAYRGGFDHARAGQFPARGLPPQLSGQAAAPIERRSPGSGMRAGHLGAWLRQHNTLSLQQQQQALEREPGFRGLPSQEQQHIRDRLAQLDSMPPRQRQRFLDYTEAMERLDPTQRADVRGVMQQLGAFPPDQRHLIGRSFRELRDVPPEQRILLLNSGRYNWMTPPQRATLDNLLRIAPLLPPPEQ